MQIDTTCRKFISMKNPYFLIFSLILLSLVARDYEGNYFFFMCNICTIFMGFFSHCVTSNPFNLDRINLVYGDTNCFWRPSNWQFMAVLEWTEMQQTAAIAISATMIFFVQPIFCRLHYYMSRRYIDGFL